jgi:hypothetical protein
MEEMTYEEAMQELGFILAVFIDNVGILATKEIVTKLLNQITDNEPLSKDNCRQSDVAGLRGI